MTNPRLELVRGRTARYQVSITDDSGAAVDLTGASVFFTVRKTLTSSPDDSDALLQAIIGDGISVTSAPGGTVQIVIAQAKTRNLVPGAYCFDLTVITAGGDTITPAMGQFIIKGEVTRRTS